MTERLDRFTFAEIIERYEEDCFVRWFDAGVREIDGKRYNMVEIVVWPSEEDFADDCEKGDDGRNGEHAFARYIVKE